MNKTFQRIDVEDVLFFDIETVRLSKELQRGTKEFEIYKKKLDKKENGQPLSTVEVQEDYEKNGGLKRVYNKIVTIGVGYVHNGKVYIQDISGEEGTVIEEFCKMTKKKSYICGFNNIDFDLPIIVGNGMKYFNVPDVLPDVFNPSGKKPWELKVIIDLMHIFKGTHWYPNSLDDLCYHFGIESPKDGEIEGSQVSEEYYTNGIKRISEYVKKDVFSSIQLFQKMQYKPLFEGYIDKNPTEGEQTVESQQVEELQDIPVLQQLYLSTEFPEDLEKYIQEFTAKKKLTKADKENLIEILAGVWINTDFVNGNQDSKKTKEEKLQAIQSFVQTL